MSLAHEKANENKVHGISSGPTKTRRLARQGLSSNDLKPPQLANVGIGGCAPVI
jgi:hypothetical protein